MYFVDGLKKTFLSKDALAQLRVIPKNFPVAGADALEEELVTAAVADAEEPNHDGKPGLAACGCPVRTTAPDPPTLDRDIQSYSVEELKQIILKHYSSSTFNTSPCP